MNFSNTPYSKSTGLHLGKFARGVSIIGVGCTPFGSVLSTPSIKDFSDRELIAWAAQEAMTDAGVTPKDVNAMILAQIGSQIYYSQSCANVTLVDWLGLRGKPNTRHESACCSSYLAFDHACTAIASGKCDMVIVVGADTDKDYPYAYQPPHMRHPFSEYKGQPHHPTNGYNIYDHAYTRWTTGNILSWVDEAPNFYMKKHGLSYDQMQDVQDAISVSLRRSASKNPRAHLQDDLETEAKKHGYDDVHEYLRSDYNRPYTSLTRRNHVLLHSDGGGAMVLCASELAKKYCAKPIEVLGTGISSMDGRHPMYTTRFKEEAFRQVFELTGVKSEELDLMYTTDMCVSEILVAAEMVGYCAEGEAWKHALNGDFAYDGARPVNTQGGTVGFGHSWGGQIFETMVEAVWQMRGECGERQVNKLPKTVLVNGWGGAQCDAATILRVQE